MASRFADRSRVFRRVEPVIETHRLCHRAERESTTITKVYKSLFYSEVAPRQFYGVSEPRRRNLSKSCHPTQDSVGGTEIKEATGKGS